VPQRLKSDTATNKVSRARAQQFICAYCSFAQYDMTNHEQQPTIKTYQQAEFDKEHRLKEDMITLVSEYLYGPMRSKVYEYVLAGDDLLAEDGGSLRAILEDAAAEAGHEPFEQERRQIELSELDDVISVAQNKTEDNVLIVVSDFPEEVREKGESIESYDILRQQAMVRVMVRTEKGIAMQSFSLDRSDRQGLEAIYAAFGLVPREGRLLEQRIFASIPEVNSDKLSAMLINQYDTALRSRYGREFKAGILQNNNQILSNTVDFVREQTDLIRYYIDTVNEHNKTEMLGVTAGLMKRRWEGVGVLDYSPRVSIAQTLHYDPRVIAEQHQVVKTDMVAKKEVVLACGTRIQLTQEDSVSQAENLGYSRGDQDKTCRILKNGDLTNCPHCKKKVTVEVKKTGGKDILKCSNPTCREASESAKKTAGRISISNLFQKKQKPDAH
jgi:hypothetical protein